MRGVEEEEGETVVVPARFALAFEAEAERIRVGVAWCSGDVIVVTIGVVGVAKGVYSNVVDSGATIFFIFRQVEFEGLLMFSLDSKTR